MLDRTSGAFAGLRGGVVVPTGGGDAGGKKAKKKSKEQLEKELKRRGNVAPVAPMTFEVIKPKRKEKF
jgi:hypothetical protein